MQVLLLTSSSAVGQSVVLVHDIGKLCSHVTMFPCHIWLPAGATNHMHVIRHLEDT